MKRTFAIAIIAMVAAGCGGPVLGTTDLAMPSSDDYATQLTYGLPVAYFPITVKRDKDCSLTASLDKPVYARDRNWDLRLHYYHHGYTNDTLSFQTDDAGLLTAINTTSENQSLAIVDQAFSIAAQALKADLVRSGGPATPTCSQFTVTYIFNPLEESQREALNELLKKSDGDVQNILVGGPTLAGTNKLYKEDSCTPGNCSLPQKDFCKDADKTTDQCIYFRRMRTFVLPIDDTKSDTKVQLTFQAPDSEIYAIPMRRDDFVKFDVRLTFSHGVLTGYTSNNPSEVLAILQIPSDLIKGIVGLDTSSSSAATGSKKN